jgi:hypothetical protein
MGQKARILKSQKPILIQTEPDLLAMLVELEKLEEKVRLAEAANRVLH